MVFFNLFKREGERARGPEGVGGAGVGRRSRLPTLAGRVLKQGPRSLLKQGPRSRVQGFIPRHWDHDPSERQTLNRLSKAPLTF